MSHCFRALKSYECKDSNYNFFLILGNYYILNILADTKGQLLEHSLLYLKASIHSMFIDTMFDKYFTCKKMTDKALTGGH